MFSFIYFLYDIYLFIESLCFSCPLPPCILAFVTLLLPSHYFAHSLPVCLSLPPKNFFYFPLGVCFNLVIFIAHSLSLDIIYTYMSVSHPLYLYPSMSLSLSLFVFISP